MRCCSCHFSDSESRIERIPRLEGDPERRVVLVLCFARQRRHLNARMWWDVSAGSWMHAARRYGKKWPLLETTLASRRLIRDVLGLT